MAATHFPSERPAAAVGTALSLVVWAGGHGLGLSRGEGNQYHIVTISRGFGVKNVGLNLGSSTHELCGL